MLLIFAVAASVIAAFLISLYTKARKLSFVLSIIFSIVASIIYSYPELRAEPFGVVGYFIIFCCTILGSGLGVILWSFYNRRS